MSRYPGYAVLALPTAGYLKLARVVSRHVLPARAVEASRKRADYIAVRLNASVYVGDLIRFEHLTRLGVV